jgi:hypothetical protein
MNDAGLVHVVRRLLSAKTTAEAKAFIETLGDDYAGIASELLNRLTFARTMNQNALLHKWFGQIAKQQDETASAVKGYCHRHFGLPIRLRNPQFAWVWKHSGESLNYEQQCSLLASGVLRISSGMTTKELSEYMDEIEQHYRPKGVHLVQPDDAE